MHVVSLVLMLLLPQGFKVPAGTRVDARLESSINTQTSKVGDEVISVLMKPISGRLLGRIETISAATESNEGRVRIVFREIETPDKQHIQTWITEAFMASPPKRVLRYFLLTGGGGAAGALIGGSRLRAAGTLGGAIIGFLLVTNSGNAKLPDLALRPGRILHLRLGEDLVLR